jgi:ribonucleoside-diphosphate reductase alpha chain
MNKREMTVNEWLNNEELPITIWKNKYQQDNETFEQWLDRVSGSNEDVKELIRKKKFIFGGRILSNRGIKGRSLTYSNCYVITPPEDNLESIFATGAKLARTFSYGGGCGIDVSKLRPKGAPVNNAAKSTTGTTSFMDFYSYITGLIGQEGRRGATMISISCEHPDLIEFINLKSNLDICTKANISVRVTDSFMQAVDENSDFTLHFTMEDGSEIKKIVNAREVFLLLAKRNWEMAEPGMLYWDRISNYNLLQNSGFRYAGVNPCAEEPLPAGGSCLLGSINLSEFVVDPFTDKAYIDYESLESTTITAIRALNDVLIEGLPLHPLQEQRETVGDWRQIGLGTLGLGDMLIMLGLKYGSKESLEVIDEVYKEIATNSILASLELAKERGAFPKCSRLMKQTITTSDFVKNLELPLAFIDEIQRNGLYNSQLLTCAPTGSIGTMLQVSTGVEPNYAFSYNRRTISLNSKETTYKVDTKIVSDYKRITGNDMLPDYFVSASDIHYKDRIKVQSVLQRYIDASISSTINLPNSCTVEEVADIYMESWKQGLKGVTIWRDGCNRQGILSTDKNKKTEEDTDSKPEDKFVFIPTQVKKTSDDCIGRKRTLVTGCGTLHLTGFFCRHTGQLLETYFSKGSQGGCALFMVGLSRMVSLAARANVPIEKIVDQLMSSGTCPSYAVRRATKKDTSKGSSCPVAIGFALMDMYNEIQKELNIKPIYKVETSNSFTEVENPKCPKCGEELSMVEGCMSCPSCGYSKCN